MSSHKPAGVDPNLFTRRIDELRAELQNADPFKLAEHTASKYTGLGAEMGSFNLALWGKETLLSFPYFIAYDQQTGQVLHDGSQALLLYYFRTADSTLLSMNWISFSELPDGRFYNHAFQGYTGKELARNFQDDLVAFRQAAAGVGCLKQTSTCQTPGDLALEFQILPKVPLLVIFWQGDEDFPSTYQILFDASASHFLPTDVCAILGSMLTRKLIQLKPLLT